MDGSMDGWNHGLGAYPKKHKHQRVNTCGPSVHPDPSNPGRNKTRPIFPLPTPAAAAAVPFTAATPLEGSSARTNATPSSRSTTRNPSMSSILRGSMMASIMVLEACGARGPVRGRVRWEGWGSRTDRKASACCSATSRNERASSISVLVLLLLRPPPPRPRRRGLDAGSGPHPHR